MLGIVTQRLVVAAAVVLRRGDHHQPAHMHTPHSRFAILFNFIVTKWIKNKEPPTTHILITGQTYCTLTCWIKDTYKIKSVPLIAIPKHKNINTFYIIYNIYACTTTKEYMHRIAFVITRTFVVVVIVVRLCIAPIYSSLCAETQLLFAIFLFLCV